MTHKSLFIASTGQNIGKTTVCLGLFSGLKQKFQNVSYIKPVGQEWTETLGGLPVDKDILLFKEHFQLTTSPKDMSPVLLPDKFTRKYLDKEIILEDLQEKIGEAFYHLQKESHFTLIEGTGHVGVGSIIDLNNAQVAKKYNTKIVLIAPGGIGSAFDQIVLNKSLCDQYGVEILGIILNKVHFEKIDMVQKYMKKALKKIGLPLLGCLPYDNLLGTPTLQDFAALFQTSLLAGETSRLHHYQKVRMVATPVDVFEKTLKDEQVIITHSAREDLILSTLSKFFEAKEASCPLHIAMILTGTPPRPPIIAQIKKADFPCLLSPFDSFTTMKKITHFTAKIAIEDSKKIHEAIQIVEKGVDFDTLFQKL